MAGLLLNLSCWLLGKSPKQVLHSQGPSPHTARISPSALQPQPSYPSWVCCESARITVHVIVSTVCCVVWGWHPPFRLQARLWPADATLLPCLPHIAPAVGPAWAARLCPQRISLPSPKLQKWNVQGVLYPKPSRLNVPFFPQSPTRSDVEKCRSARTLTFGAGISIFAWKV